MANLTLEQQRAVAIAQAKAQAQANKAAANAPPVTDIEGRPPIGVDPAEGPLSDKNHWAVDLRPAFVAAGGMVGGVVGGGVGAVGGGPVAPVTSIGGMAVGSALGTAGGAAAHENFLDILRTFGVEGLPPPPDLAQRVQDSAEEAVMDLGFTTAMGGLPVLGQMYRGGRKAVADAVGRVFGKSSDDVIKTAEEVLDPLSIRGWSRRLGVRERGARLAQEGDRLGVDLAIAQVTDGRIAGLFSKVLARFPLIGGPARQQALMVQEQSIAAGERLLLRMGPSMNMADLGIDLNRAADARFSVFRDEINEMYRRARSLATSTNATIPTDYLKKNSKMYLRQMKETFGELDPSNPAVAFFQKIEAMEDSAISFARYDGLTIQLDEALARAKNDGLNYGALAAFKAEVMERALSRISNPEVKALLDEADGKFAKTMREVFETNTAQRFNRIEKNRFGVGFSRPGTRNLDEAFEIVFKQQTNSRQAMRDLRSLLNPNFDPVTGTLKPPLGKNGKPLYPDANDDTFRAAVQYHIDDVFHKGVQVNPADGATHFDIHGIRQRLGITNKRSGTYQGLKEALDATGVPMPQVESLINVMEATLRNAPDDVNAFIARRATLGGRKALVSTLTAGTMGATGGVAAGGAGIGAGLISGVTFLLTARSFGSIVSDPNLLRASTVAMDNAAGFLQRKAALQYLVHYLSDDPAASFSEQLNELMGTAEEDGLGGPVSIAR